MLVKGKTCKTWAGADHFASQCRTKTGKPRNKKKLKEKMKVRYMHGEDHDEEDERLKEKQDAIYFMAGTSRKEVSIVR